MSNLKFSPSVLSFFLFAFFLIPFSLFPQTSQTVWMCTDGNAVVSTAPNGTLYDSGGPNGYYYDGEYCSLLIDPGCAVSLTFAVQEFFSEGCCDFLRVYDGDNENAPLLLYLYGQPAPQTVYSSSGQLFVRWYSDGSVTYPGFRATWSSTLVPPAAPVVNFTVSDANPALQEPVQFTGSSTNYPTFWQWDFGDNFSSTQQNPTHAYATPGTYTVRLIVTNCHNLSDTTEQTVQVQQAPSVVVNPTSLELTANCGDTAQTVVTLTNTGQGDLLYNVNKNSNDGKIKVLLYTYNASFYSRQGLLEVLNNPVFSAQYEVTESLATDSATFSAQLDDHDILVFADLPPSFETFLVLNALKNSILDFVDKGGSIVFCGQQYGGDVLPLTGFFSSPNFIGSDYSYVTATFGVQHPITAGVPSTYTVPYVTVGVPFDNPDYVSLCTFNTFSLYGFKEVGNAKLVYFGSNFYTYDGVLQILFDNTLQWCGSRSRFIIEPSEGQVPPGESVDLTLRFPTDELIAGDYGGTLSIETNDPAQPNVDVPYTLHVVGAAALEASPTSLDFGDLMQFREKTLSVQIDNTGCDTLVIQSISSSLAGYAAEPAQLTVPPFSTDSFRVIFAPTDTGQYNGMLTLTSNVGTNTLPLNGYATGAPIASVSPMSLEATVACGDSVTLPVTVTNTGLGDLNIAANGATSSSGTGTLKILMLNAGTYDSYIASMVTQTVAQYPEFQVSIFENQPIAQLADSLVGKNLVIIPFVGFYDVSFYQQLGQIVRPFVEAGGGAIFTGTHAYQNLNAYGLLQSSGDLNIYYAPPLDAVAPQHPVLEAVDLQATVFDEVFGHKFLDANYESLVEVYQYSAVGVRQAGLGKVAFLGFRYAYPHNNATRALKNAVNWCARPEWVSAEPAILTVPPGESATLNVKFNAKNLVETTYTSTYSWATNDPLTPFISVPCTLHVEGEPSLESSLANLNFGIIQQFAQKTLEVPIKNTGCDTLNLTGISTDNPVFSPETYPNTLLPGQSGKVAVKFTPQLPGGQAGILTIETDGGAATVQLAGNAVGAPVASVNPAALEVQLTCDEAATLPITLNNNGLGGYNFQTGGLGSPRRIVALTYGATLYRWENIRYYIQQNIPGVSIAAYSGTDANALADSLAANADVLIVPPLEYINDPATFAAFSLVVQDFLENGGQVLAFGGYYTEPLVQMGLFGSFYNEIFYAPNIRVVDKTHPLTQLIPENYYSTDYCYFGYFSANDLSPLLKGPADNQIFLGHRKVGSGNVLYWGQTFDLSDTRALQLLDNIFAWFANPVPPGVTVTTAFGFVPSGGSQTVQVEFNGEGLPGGQYQGQIHLFGNDPVNNPLVIPVTLNIDYQPCADFSVQIGQCNGKVVFSDKTVNALTSWYWDFGDGGTSFSQNPTHTYAGGGTFNVTMIGCNNVGCDTTSQTIQVNPPTGPVSINCQPQTVNYCCEAGIAHVQIGDLYYSSGNASEGYQDYSCTQGTELMAGSPYPITVVTGPQTWEYVRVWIDYNNNGIFGTNELVFSDEALGYHQGSVAVPLTAVKNVPLRMRVLSEPTWASPPISPCLDLGYGQAEDYFVVVKTMVGTDEPASNLHARLYPNPSAGETWLEFTMNNTEPVAVKITDQTGRVVWENRLENAASGLNKLRLPELPAGAFAVTLQSGAAVAVQKLVRVDRP